MPMFEFIDSFFTKNKTALFTFLIFGCICGVICRYEFAWWDAANYHYYNPWAFLNDRLHTDVVPAVVNTFFSPFIDFPYYFLVNALNEHPLAFCAVMAVPYGLMLFFSYKIATLFFPADTEQGRIRIGLTVLLCVCSETVFFQLCSSSHEHLMSFLVLMALYPLLKEISVRRFKTTTFLISGFVLGAAAGLKLTYAPYAAATGITLIAFHKHLNNPLKNISVFTFAGIVGFSVAYGYWGWVLWKNFQNPFFPFFNGIFQSPYWDGPDYKDMRYYDKSWLTVLFYPFFLFWNIGHNLPLQQWIVVSNLRLVFGVAFFLIALIRIIKNKKENRSENDDALLNLLMFWMTVVYLLWLIFFRVYRYMIPFEQMLSIVLIRFIFGKQKINTDNKRLFGLLFFVAFMVASMFQNYGSYYVWPSDQPLIPIKPAPLPDNTLLILNDIPSALFVPFLAPNQTVRTVIDPKLKKEFNGSAFYASGHFALKRNEIIQEYRNNKKPVAYLSRYDHGSGKSCQILEVFGIPFSLCLQTDDFQDTEKHPAGQNGFFKAK